MQCPRCQHKNPPRQKFCGECGTPVAGVAPARPDTDLKDEIEGLRRSLTEALEQQTATSELLKVIGQSTFDLQPVFETMAENAVKLCEATQAFIFRFDGHLLRVVATHGTSTELRAFFEQNPIAPGRGSVAGRT